MIHEYVPFCAVMRSIATRGQHNEKHQHPAGLRNNNFWTWRKCNWQYESWYFGNPNGNFTGNCNNAKLWTAGPQVPTCFLQHSDPTAHRQGQWRGFPGFFYHGFFSFYFLQADFCYCGDFKQTLASHATHSYFYSWPGVNRTQPSHFCHHQHREDCHKWTDWSSGFLMEWHMYNRCGMIRNVQHIIYGDRMSMVWWGMCTYFPWICFFRDKMN